MLKPTDLDDLLLIVGDPEVMKYLGVQAGATLNRDEARQALANMIQFWNQHGFGRWGVVDKLNGKLIGLCGLRLLEGAPELVYGVSKSNWGRGLATEAAKASLRYGFEELGLERIVAVTRHANEASKNVLIKIGMSYEKEVTHYGVEALCYVATRLGFQPSDSTYVLSRD